MNLMSDEIVINPAPKFYCDLCEHPIEKMQKVTSKTDGNRWLILCKEDLKALVERVIQ